MTEEDTYFTGTEAEAYFLLAKAGIEIATSEDGLRQWWKDELRNRLKFRLSVLQVDILLESCNIRMGQIARGED